MNYLVKTSSNYYKIRIRINDTLQPYFTRQEINKSLNTKKYKEAILLSKSIISEFNKISLGYTLGLYTEELLISLITTFFNDVLKQDKPKFNLNQTSAPFTHIEALDEFKRYYLELDIGDKKRNLVLNFLYDLFMPLMNPKSPLSSTSLDKMLTVKRTLEKFPKRTKGKYKKLSMSQLLKIKDIPIEDRIAPMTEEFYFIACKRFYNYCIAQGYLSINPCNFITIKKDSSAQEEREPFTIDEVSRYLKLFDKEEPIKRDILYTLAYTGLRASELWKGTIKKDKDDIWYLDLTDKNIKLKTKGSYRLVPLHSELIKRGIHLSLPSAIKSINTRVILDNFSIRIKPQVTNSSKKVLYSLRHTVATELKYLGVDSLVISELLGHSHSGMTMGRYASRYPLKVLKEAIDKLKFI